MFALLFPRVHDRSFQTKETRSIRVTWSPGVGNT